MDDDLDSLSHAALLAHAKQLRAGIRAHRDASAHRLCWFQPQLWDLLPDRDGPSLVVPEWPQFLRGCVKYRESLDQQVPAAARTRQEFED